MTIWRHLYDPSTDTHYTNGGFISEDAPTPVDGWQWVEGYAPNGSPVYEKRDLSARLEAILKEAGQVLAAEQNPSPELLALVDGIMTIDTKLSNLSNRFGGDSALYKAAAIAYLNSLGVLPENLEPARLAMLDECEA